MTPVRVMVPRHVLSQDTAGQNTEREGLSQKVKLLEFGAKHVSGVEVFHFLFLTLSIVACKAHLLPYHYNRA